MFDRAVDMWDLLFWVGFWIIFYYFLD